MKFLVDENFTGAILRGINRYYPDLDVIRVQDSQPGLPDPQVLEWAAKEGRVLLTHDRRTMIGFVYERIDAGKEMSGVILVEANAPIGLVIEDIIITIETADTDGLTNIVRFIPLT